MSSSTRSARYHADERIGEQKYGIHRRNYLFANYYSGDTFSGTALTLNKLSDKKIGVAVVEPSQLQMNIDHTLALYNL